MSWLQSRRPHPLLRCMTGSLFEVEHVVAAESDFSFVSPLEVEERRVLRPVEQGRHVRHLSNCVFGVFHGVRFVH